ncbi:stage II sporulation protein R [Ruminococcus flavefaciens]|uniref:stage II sporulation protein R n=1 Tax=Ruminococcus flavefaciens TaxID=1265 RepID=UPI00056CCA16|nr:stage II sporulation protein R [Ruminococcus flavefaciens]
MRKQVGAVMAAGLILAILISNIGSFISDGRKLDELRGSVLRLHILANSDSEQDQRLKLMVRDKLLESGLFESAESLSQAEAIAEEKLDKITDIAERVLRENGCNHKVTAELADVDFGDRTYGDITMPAGRYRALRIKIGSAQGHNWWCVMYPPLCLPAACEAEDGVGEDESAAEANFDEKELDILHKPRKYKVRFAIWDKIKSIISDDDVQNAKNQETP